MTLKKYNSMVKRRKCERCEKKGAWIVVLDIFGQGWAFERSLCERCISELEKCIEDWYSRGMIR